MEQAEKRRFFIFSVGGGLYAFESKLVGEIVSYDRAFELPLSPDYMIGLIGRYGVVFALLDTAKIMGLPATNSKKALLLKDPTEKIAFAIDDAIDIAEIEAKDLIKIEREGETGAARFAEKRFMLQDAAVVVLSLEMLLLTLQNDLSQEDFSA